MKKVLATAIALLPLIASAQYFEMTPDGIVSVEDNAKRYVVVPMEGTQAELFNKAKTAVTTMWNSPKDVLSYNEPDVIIVNGYYGGIYVKTIGITNYFDMHYRIQLMFKDGKVRIELAADKATVQGKNGTYYFCAGKNSMMQSIAYVFDDKGKLKQKGVKEQVENYFNTLVAALVDKIKGGAASDDW